MSHTARQSTRATRAVAVEQTPGGEGASSSAAGSVAQVTSVPPRKQARTTKSTRSKKKKVDSLSGLLTLPVELFTEVMRELKPIDILNLSRTCKSFRNILMRRSSEPIWQRAAKNLSYRLPPPPPWLDMPQYVSVVYTDDCSACGGKAVPKTGKWDPEFQPALLVRLCVACQPNVLVRFQDIPEYAIPLVVITYVKIFPGPGINMRSDNYGLRTEIQKLQKEFKENKEKSKTDGSLLSWLLAKEDSIKNYSRLGSLPWSSSHYLRIMMAKMTTHQAPSPHWDIIEYVEQAREREENIKRQFRHGVENRLNELGWEHDMNYIEWEELWSLIGQPRNLTDRIWKNLYPKLQTPLEKARSLRLVELPVVQMKALIHLWENKYHELGTRIIVHPRQEAVDLKTAGARLVPPASDAISWTPVKQILDSCPTYFATHQQLPESWEQIRPLVETWQQNVESQLANRLQEDESFTSALDSSASSMAVSGRPVSEELNVLLRADSVFRFTDNRVRCFPDDFLEIWRPQCVWIRNGLSTTSPSIVEGAQSFTVAREQAKALLQCLGHPDASHLGMTACGKRFVCGTCVTWKHKYLKVYDWKGLLDHYTSCQLDEPEPDGTVPDPTEDNLFSFVRTVHHPEIDAGHGYPLVHTLSADDARKYAQDTSTLLTEQPWLSYDNKHACLHCTDCSGVDLPAVLAHVQYTHYIMEPEAHRDYDNYEVYIRQSLEVTYEYASGAATGESD
ncbi:hypothetical protein RSAG8_04337, partial [Rhizoctonia solani AG-8 WAC10335]